MAYDPSMMARWTIAGAESEPIIGNTHLPPESPRGVAVIAHGFKGYKDYGMLPRIARELASNAGLVAHRFNFSHSGMTDRIETFERPDLFERDTWSKQVHDLTAVLDAVGRGELAGRGLPAFIIGHSRGGVSAILTAARLTYPATAQNRPGVAGVITIAAPATGNPLSRDEESELLRQGFLESPSSRTGQRLRIGRAFLQEQLDDPASYDVLACVERLTCPMLIIHGERDPTVLVDAAHALARAAGQRATLHVIAGADHVLNTSNPLPDDQAASAALREAIGTMAGWIGAILDHGRG